MAKQPKSQKRSASKPKVSRDIMIARTRARKLEKMVRHMEKQPNDFTTEYAMQCHALDPITKR